MKEGAFARFAIGALAGLTATAAMTAAMRKLHATLPPDERYPLPPRQITETTLDVSGEAAARDSTLLAHFGYGAAIGAIYGVLGHGTRIINGALFGVLVWAGSYLGWIPGLGVLKPATEHPLRRNALMLAVHVVWGATLVATIRELLAARRDIFAAGELRDARADPGAREAPARALPASRRHH